MSKQYPDYMGNYKAIVLDTALTKAKTSGMPQFAVRLCFSEYYDPNEQQWFDVSDNNWVMTAYLNLYGRKGSQPDGEIVETLNHQQVCKVFGWNGIGFGHLVGTDFSGKIVMARVAENDYEQAKTPVQIAWIDTEDADPNSGLQKLDEKAVKDLETEFASLWAGKKTAKAPVASAPKAGKKPAPPAPKATEPETPPADPKEAKKKALLEKSKRLRAEAEKTAKTTSTPPAKGKPSDQSDEDGNAVPAGYDKRQAWLDVVELKDNNCDDNSLNVAWQVAIAEIAKDGNEDKLDAEGWWAVKEQVLNDIGTL